MRGITLIIGGGGPLGEATVHEIAQRSPVAVLDSNPDALHKYVGLDQVSCFTLDASDEDQVKALASRICGNQEHVNAVVHMVSPDSSMSNPLMDNRLDHIDVATFTRELSVPLSSALVALKVFVPLMRLQSRSSFVFVSSDLGVIAPDQRVYRSIGRGKVIQKSPAYTSAKHAIIGLMKHAATVLAEDGIAVNAVAPGPLVTNQPPELARELESRIPMGRLGQVHEAAQVINYLCFDAPAFMTGSTLVVDGGRTVW